MKKNRDKIPKIDQSFSEFTAELRVGNGAAWNLLIKHFRQVTIPWIQKRTGKLPAYALMTREEFASEVFAESLSKFYTLFPEGEFKRFQDLQSLLFKISELKIKEGFASIKREQRLYRPASSTEMESAIQNQVEEEDVLLKKKIELVYRYLNTLPETDQSLLKRYYWGEKLIDIAHDLDISEANCRKRKQRALEKLKSHFFNPIIGIILWLWIENILTTTM